MEFEPAQATSSPEPSPARGQALRLTAKAAVLVMVFAFCLSIAPRGGGGRASAAPAFAPVPCGDVVYRKSDPTFAALPGAKAFFGEYAGGLYRAEIPDNWNGDLVLYAHGYAGEGDLLSVQNPQADWREYLIQQGFAWAASSYRCNGYAPGIALQDTMLLPPIVQNATLKAPAHTYLTGQSMGGFATVLGLQEFPTTFAGGLALCAAGPRLVEMIGANSAAAEVVTGLRFSSAEPSSATLKKMLAILGTPPAYSAQGLQLASIEINSTGGPRPFAFDGLAAYFAVTLAGAGLAGEKLPTMSSAATNQDWVYGIDPAFGLTIDQLNAQVRRIPPQVPENRSDAGPYSELKPLTGKIARPLLTMHSTGDMYVPIFLERDLRAAVVKAGNGDLLVQRIYRIPAHCQFSGAEIIQSFNDMVAWARNGTKPAGDDINASFENAGLKFTNPLRPGDPGMASPVARPATPQSPPAPPSTGSGGAPSGSHDTSAWAIMAGVVLLLGVATVFARGRISRN